MENFIRAILAVTLGLFSVSAFSVPVRYAYTGHPFELVGAGLPDVTAISAAIVLPDEILPDTLVDIDFVFGSNFLEFSITDGVTVVTDDDVSPAREDWGGGATLITDDTGAVSEWFFNVVRPVTLGNIGMSTINFPQNPGLIVTDELTYCFFVSGSGCTGAGAWVRDNPGSWTITPIPIPIPAGAWLFGSALGLLGWVKRRSA